MDIRGSVRTDDKVQRALDDALSLRRRCEAQHGDVLAQELARLERLQALSQANAPLWRKLVAPRAEELALWLYGIAIGVGALGLPREAMALLEVLDGVPGGGRGRRELLWELLEAQRGAENLAACG